VSDTNRSVASLPSFGVEPVDGIVTVDGGHAGEVASGVLSKDRALLCASSGVSVGATVNTHVVIVSNVVLLNVDVRNDISDVLNG